MTTCRLSECIGPAFYPVHRAIRSGDYDQFILSGGRGSLKSSFVSMEMLLLLISHPSVHGVVLRKVQRTLRRTVFPQYLWAAEKLGLGGKLQATVEPMELKYLPTGQKIFFLGAEDPGALKSIRPPFGYLGLMHLEEWDQFGGMGETRNLQQSVLRGGDETWCFMTFNPPADPRNHACYVPERPRQLIHKSTYLEAPEKWLGQRFLEDAAVLKRQNPAAYAHEYLGKPGSGGRTVFQNLTLREIPEEEREAFDRLCSGVDWGYYPDPWAYNRMHYDASRRTLYIFHEETRYRTGNRETAQLLLEIAPEETIIADSAEKKSIDDYRDRGLDCKGAKKGPGSVAYSIRWLQSLREIVIDPVRCPDTAREFSGYCYDTDGLGNILGGYPDRDNHHIDAVRYGLEPVWRRRD